ncbi:MULTISPECIES: hypothetical protein [Streptomyces]|uniref:hypothetical protein n=1 Tax=Streptomyces TaxID=1883 RepID=UPI001673D8CB|nr:MULTISPECIES: hypothetical protein [Streptomyces]GGR75569.1 hypothetical protein GCM10010236_32850 [Streptomyces eurythermus]
MKTAEHTELIRRLADDFTALQTAVLSQVNGPPPSPISPIRTRAAANTGRRRFRPTRTGTPGSQTSPTPP